MPRGLPKKVLALLEKAKDSALLAVEIYNKPRTSFKSSGFITLMTIAYAALFHAYFEKKGIKYFHRKKDSRRYERVDGDYKAWELPRCAEEYYKSKSEPIYKNIDFIYRIRNKIEHRFIPEIDNHILGECQAMLINFEYMLEKHFGIKHSISDILNIPLQTSRGKRKIPSSTDAQKVIDFIKNYRSSLSKKIKDSQNFSFKVFLVPKIGNHRNTSDVAIEFVDFDLDDKNQLGNIEQIQALIKYKQVPVANQGKYRVKDVISEIKTKTGKKLTPHWHVQMWKKYKVRPGAHESKKDKCKPRYCQYDVVHNDYVYTEDWVNLLIKEEIVKN
ncbi:hypothetical protein BMS3Abin15_01022 [bacterium BMS3Abin15]|nr:hypothetical protein BMS3Abin15_01022 [bacterium BMS3Abin15]HDZ85148.1 DUF3644 domain-containing protein [Candidatus Moranbacteria bacterium]